MSDEKIVNFPIGEDRVLSYEQASSLLGLREPKYGLLIGVDENDRIFHFTFGDVRNKDTLWIAEYLRDFALGRV